MAPLKLDDFNKSYFQKKMKTKRLRTSSSNVNVVIIRFETASYHFSLPRNIRCRSRNSFFVLATVLIVLLTRID